VVNVVIANQQQTFSHFEDAIAFTSDHLTIQGRGHPDGSITSAEMISHLTARSWAVEAKITVPSADKTWAAFGFMVLIPPTRTARSTPNSWWAR